MGATATFWFLGKIARFINNKGRGPTPPDNGNNQSDITINDNRTSTPTVNVTPPTPPVTEYDEPNESLITQFFTGETNKIKSTSLTDNAPSISEHKDVLDITDRIYGPESLILHGARRELGNIILEDKDKGKAPMVLSLNKTRDILEDVTDLKDFNIHIESELANLNMQDPTFNTKYMKVRMPLAAVLNETEQWFKEPLTESVAKARREGLLRLKQLYNKLPAKSSITEVVPYDLGDSSSSGSITPTQTAPSTPQITHKVMDNTDLPVENPFDNID